MRIQTKTSMRRRVNRAGPSGLVSYSVIDLSDEESNKEGITWWEELTASGGEGMVVKPSNLLPRADAVSCNRR